MTIGIIKIKFGCVAIFLMMLSTYEKEPDATGGSIHNLVYTQFHWTNERGILNKIELGWEIYNDCVYYTMLFDTPAQYNKRFQVRKKKEKGIVT